MHCTAYMSQLGHVADVGVVQQDISPMCHNLQRATQRLLAWAVPVCITLQLLLRSVEQTQEIMFSHFTANWDANPHCASTYLLQQHVLCWWSNTTTIPSVLQQRDAVKQCTNRGIES